MPLVDQVQVGLCDLMMFLFLRNAKKKKIEKVSKSEADCKVMSTACFEIVRLQLVSDLGFPQASSALLYTNNKSAIQITENPMFHERTKPIEVDCHYI